MPAAAPGILIHVFDAPSGNPAACGARATVTAPGFSEVDQSFTATNLSNLTLPVPSIGAPLSTVPLTGVGSHTQTLYTYDPNIRTPYVQNYSFSLERFFRGNTIVTLNGALST